MRILTDSRVAEVPKIKLIFSLVLLYSLSDLTKHQSRTIWPTEELVKKIISVKGLSFLNLLLLQTKNR